jgi:hypothetical protein
MERKMKIRIIVASLLLVLLVACSKQSEQYADAAAPQMESDASVEKVALSQEPGMGRGKAGAMLAYEHHVTLRANREEIQARMASVRDACMSEKFGACTLLGENLTTGDYPSGYIQMRLVPKAVDGVVQAGAKGAELAERRTTAEDLADAVQNTEMRQKRLKLHHEKLMELLARKDIKGEELLGLTQQLSEVESQLDAASQESAQQQRRIETNMLTIQFESIGFDADSSEIKQSLQSFVGTLDSSVAFVITAFAALLPFILMLGAFVWIIRWWLRRGKRNASHE